MGKRLNESQPNKSGLRAVGGSLLPLSGHSIPFSEVLGALNGEFGALNAGSVRRHL
jgi:hypothetical protein